MSDYAWKYEQELRRASKVLEAKLGFNVGLLSVAYWVETLLADLPNAPDYHFDQCEDCGVQAPAEGTINCECGHMIVMFPRSEAEQ